MTQLFFEELRQRADYTHKFNTKNNRHGWLRLTPAYGVRVVEEVLAKERSHLRVLDPFCGTATTALCASYHGHTAVTTDINPFLVWLGKAKSAVYSEQTIESSRRAGRAVCQLLASLGLVPTLPPPIHNITRWWEPDAINFLCRLQAAISQTCPASSAEFNLLTVAFCRSLIACSNAAFNHQSMSFKKASTLASPDYEALFKRDLDFVLQGAQQNPTGHATILLQDARQLALLSIEPVDLVITSPPYVNRMSYIRELRPYMYWLRMLTESRDAGELDWQAIGGTWGIATSRLTEWKPTENAYQSEPLADVLRRIAQPGNPNGILLAAYVRKYCVDMAEHFAGLRAVLAPNARLHYIVGNSFFYGELVSAEQLYAHMLEVLGYENINIRAIRKRNSKKGLIEFDVSASYPG